MADNYTFRPLADSTDSGGTSTDLQFRPIHEFDQSAIAQQSATRDELANMWLSKRDFLGGSGPQTPQELEAIKTKATAAGLSLDDVLAAAEAKTTPDEAASIHRYRYASPIGRGIVQSENSAVTFLTNAAYRGLSYIPGYEHLATKADENNRALETAQAVKEQLDREGSVAEILGDRFGPTAASLLGNASQGLMDVATISAVPGASGVAAEGATAEEAATTAKAAALTASKKAALYFGLKHGEQQLTVGTDHGLSPNMRIANAAVQGSIVGGFTYGFGNMAQQLGLSTTEQATVFGAPAVKRLVDRSGLAEAAAGMALSGGEQATMGFAEQSWGSLVGTDTMDDTFNRGLTNFGTGAATRGATEVLPAFQAFHDAYIKTQDALPETVKGTVAARKIIFEGAPEKPIENETPEFKAAYDSEMAAAKDMHSQASATLDEVKLGEDSIKQRMEKYLAAKKEVDTLNAGTELTDAEKQQLRDSGVPEDMIASAKPAGKQKPAANTEDVNAEGAAIRAERDKLVEKRKSAEADLQAAEEKLKAMTEPEKDSAKAKIIDDLETKQTAADLEQGKVNLTRAENKLNDSFRAQEGYDAIPEAERISMEASLRNARAQGIVQRADDIAKDIVSTKRGLSYDETNGLLEARTHRGESIKQAKLIADDESQPEAARRDAKVRIDNARKSEDIITRALKEGGSDVARALAARKHDQDNLAPAVVRETARARKGSDLTDAEAEDFTIAAEKLDKTENLARRFQEEKPAEGPISREEFARREVVRAFKSKKDFPSEAEVQGVIKAANKLYDHTSDINVLDAARNQKTADDLYVEAHHLRAELDKKILDLEPKTFGGQVAKNATFASGLLREWLTTGDLLPALRQGILHPGTWPAAFRTFFKSLGSERAEIIADRDMTRRKYYGDSQAGNVKLRIPKSNAPYEMAEGGMAQLVKNKFPLLSRFAAAYRTGVNEIRMGAFEASVDSMGGISKWESASLDRCKQFVNCGTGYGTLGGFEQSAGAMAQIMLAPRFFWSRLQYFTGWPLMKAAYAGDKTASQMMLKAYTKQICGLAAMTAFAEVAGNAAFGPDSCKFYRNPFSEDPEERFNVGRLKVGSTMIDITGGLAKPFRYATALAEPILAASQNRQTLKRTGPTLLGIARGSLAPVPSALVSAAEVYTGNKQAQPEATNYILPWSYGDIIKGFQAEGMDKASAIAAFNMFGAGSYTTERQ